MPRDFNLSSSLEDYLEAIYHIVEAKHAARAKEIAARLGVKMSSVSGALRALSGRDLINYAPYEVVTLTAKGSAAARDVIKRHRILRDFFTRVLAVDEEIADKGACEMEHSIPPEILSRFRTFAEFVENCESVTFEWIAGRGFVCEKDDQTERRCAHCENVEEGSG